MKRNIRNLLALAAILVTFFVTPPAKAQVIEDQIGPAYEHLFPHMGTRAFFEGHDSYSLPATRTVAASSGMLSSLSVAGIGVDLGSTRNMTFEEWQQVNFRVFFYPSTAVFLDDPANYTATKWFDAPSNGNWLTPIGDFNGFTRYEFTFDLQSMGLSVTAGQDFALGFAQLSSNGTRWRTCFSTGGGFGPEIDLFGADDGQVRFQDYLDNLSAPSNWHATRITVVPVPEPGTMIGIAFGVASLLIRRKRRSLG